MTFQSTIFFLNEVYFLKQNNEVYDDNCFNIKALETCHIPDRSIMVERVKIKSQNSFVLRIDYS